MATSARISRKRTEIYFFKKVTTTNDLTQV